MSRRPPALSMIFWILAIFMLATMVTELAEGKLEIKTCFENIHLFLLVFFCLAAVLSARKNSN